MAPRSDFFLAVNFPWLLYGADFGRSPWGHNGVSQESARATVASDFAAIRSSGVSVVRWFLLCDGRSGIRYENEIPAGPDEFLFADVAAALDLASQSNLRICFSLFDFLWLQTPERTTAAATPLLPGRNSLQFAAGREALLQRILIPLFREFRAHPALFAWEIVNEPEWAIPEFQRSPKATLPLADARAFFVEIADAIHQESAGVPVTLGSARLQWLRAWSEIGLDHLQAHYYPQLERGLPLSQQLAEVANLGQPLWIGELPASDPSSPNYSLEAALTACRDADLAGAGIWRWRPPESTGSDVAFGSVQPEFYQRGWRKLRNFASNGNKESGDNERETVKAKQ
jgi:hypothetical protein